MKKSMECIYTPDKEEVLIEELQKATRENVIGKYVACRKEQKLTQDNLSVLSGISRPNITRFETCKYNPSLEMMVRIAASMGMELEINLVPAKKDK